MKKIYTLLDKIKNKQVNQYAESANKLAQNLEELDSQIVLAKRAKVLVKKELTDAQKALEKSLKEPVDYSGYDKEIAELYKLPIKTFKIIREKDPILKPKIIIITKFLYLSDFPKIERFDDEEYGNDPEEEFRPYVGKPLGRFLIQYDFSPEVGGKQIMALNLTQQYDRYQHACINGGGVCFGNMAQLALDLYRDRKIYELTSLMLDYLPNPVYGNPYCDWKTWFNHNSLQTTYNIKQLLFQGYSSQQKIDKEWEQICKLIPAKELAILNRDTTNDPRYRSIDSFGLHADSNCHCNDCNVARLKYDKIMELARNMPEVLDTNITNYSLNTSNYEL